MLAYARDSRWHGTVRGSRCVDIITGFYPSCDFVSSRARVLTESKVMFFLIIGAVYVARERKWFSLFVAIAVRTMVLCVSWCAADALERGAHALRASGG